MSFRTRKKGTSAQRGKVFPVRPSNGEKYEGQPMRVQKVVRKSSQSGLTVPIKKDVEHDKPVDRDLNKIHEVIKSGYDEYTKKMESDIPFRSRSLNSRVDMIAEKFGMDGYEKSEFRMIIQKEEGDST